MDVPRGGAARLGIAGGPRPGARHPFPDVLARTLRREGSNHGGCPASNRSQLPARQLQHSATHPCTRAHGLRTASLHVTPHRNPTAIATAAPTRTTPYQQNAPMTQLRIRCADSVTCASAHPSRLGWSTNGSGDGVDTVTYGARRGRGQAWSRPQQALLTKAPHNRCGGTVTSVSSGSRRPFRSSGTPRADRPAAARAARHRPAPSRGWAC